MPALEYSEATRFRAAFDRVLRPGDQVVLLAGQGLCIGANPLQPRVRFDFESEQFVEVGDQTRPATITAEHGRTTGQFDVSLLGQKISSRSLKALLGKFLQEIEAKRPGTLDALTNVKARTRRIVAKKREDLFDNPHLAESFAEALGNGWFVNTNNSKQQVQRWLEEATKAAGLTWGKDVVAHL